MVSTNGNGPKLANIVRRKIAAGLPENIGDAIKKVGALRRKLRKIAPDIAEGPKRMQWYFSDMSSMQITIWLIEI
jgi:precorrin-2 dehydrogenase/sirohydrochlorin ferrochelatase